MTSWDRFVFLSICYSFCSAHWPYATSQSCLFFLGEWGKMTDNSSRYHINAMNPNNIPDNMNICKSVSTLSGIYFRNFFKTQTTLNNIPPIPTTFYRAIQLASTKPMSVVVRLLSPFGIGLVVQRQACTRGSQRFAWCFWRGFLPIFPEIVPVSSCEH